MMWWALPQAESTLPQVGRALPTSGLLAQASQTAAATSQATEAQVGWALPTTGLLAQASQTAAATSQTTEAQVGWALPTTGLLAQTSQTADAASQTTEAQVGWALPTTGLLAQTTEADSQVAEVPSEVPEEGGLTFAGTIIMILSVGLVLGLAGFCMVRILAESRPTERHHMPLDIDTHDT